MNTQENRILDILAGYGGQPSHGSSSGALGGEAPRKVVQVPRRLNDRVQLSQECSRRDEDSAGALCSSFMAAWG